MIHPARQYVYWELVQGLAEAVAAGYVNVTWSDDGLALYTYSKSCVYERAWNVFTLMSRGLIVDHDKEDVVATPFPKFFNYGENDQYGAPEPFEVFEKVDGSLIILFSYEGEWRAATKGSFKSDQAVAATEYLKGFDLSVLQRGTTYLCEWCSPDNRIVVHYDKPELVLLGAYIYDGSELPYTVIKAIGYSVGWRVAKRYSFASISDLVAHAETLPSTEEGFVLRFSNGLRLKVKGEEYKRIHRLISRCTPLAMWDAMRAGDDLDLLRRELPEEFWADFDSIITILRKQIGHILTDALFYYQETMGMTDKEVGLRLDKFPEHVRRFIFPMRNYGTLMEGRARDMVFRAIRPTGNNLDGYTPSRSIHRVLEEAA